MCDDDKGLNDDIKGVGRTTKATTALSQSLKNRTTIFIEGATNKKSLANCKAFPLSLRSIIS